MTAEIFFSNYSTVLRQHTAVATGLDGTIPRGPTGIVYEPRLYTNQVHTFCDPADYTLFHLTHGGLFDPSDDVFYCVTTIHSKLAGAGTITVDVLDRASTDYVRIIDTQPGAHAVFPFSRTLLIVPANLLKITTTTAGTVDVHCARIDWHR